MEVPPSHGCWVDIFELSHFRARRRRLYGPADFPNVRMRLSMDSLIVGPDAQVRLYRSADPSLTVLVLTPGQRVTDISELRVADDVDSIQILPRPLI
jgi:hypothetical protein